MKVRLVVPGILVAANLYAQGTGQGVIGLSSVGTAADNRVYASEDPWAPYGGNPCAGTAYNIAFFWRETAINPWVQIGAPIPFLTGPGAGQWLGGNRTITGLSVNGAVVDIKAQAWEVAYGSSYSEVRSRGGPAGESVIVRIKSKDPFNSLEPIPTLTSSAQWQGFVLIVPEPSVVAFGALGVGIALILRRSKPS